MENREILFRGIRKDSREWVEGVPIESNMNGEGYETFMYTDHTIHNAISLRVGGGHFGRCVEVIPETVGQFTGLLDKNGKKIFEGDVVSTDLGKNLLIIFEDCSFRRKQIDYEYNYSIPLLSQYDIEKHSLEVIGTIHDHLLKDK